MEVEDTINAIIRLPSVFQKMGNISVHDLLKQSGYFEKPDGVTAEKLHETLSEHPDCVEAWMRYSEDKRSSSGWYFKASGGGEYLVGYFSQDATLPKPQVFLEKVSACAHFIKHELDDMGADYGTGTRQCFGGCSANPSPGPEGPPSPKGEG